MALKQISSPAEASIRSRFKRSSRPEALRAWAGFLAPKEVGQLRLLNQPDQVAHHRNLLLRLARESTRRTVTPLISRPSPADDWPDADESIEALIAWSLRDENFDPAANDRIERGWDA